MTEQASRSMPGRLTLAGQWLDVTDRAPGNVIFAAEHQGTNLYVALTPAQLEEPGRALEPGLTESQHYTRRVRAAEGEPVSEHPRHSEDCEHCREYRASDKLGALDDTLDWIRKHQRGLRGLDEVAGDG